MLGSLYQFEQGDADTYQNLEVEFVQANTDGVRRCDVRCAQAQ
ncbi:hypothetical protein [Pseudomonas mosselii]|nr:hypothetical protein [Pseudomonas mosselii]MCU9527541.1 hypothetical protein [Pseudomonas mosselii]MCU9534854.1 hypothetical protein [Pseudomonas mosselii]MCU9542788.1 hypothetical protein [Pseudomonas mosselii]MCU9546694.1 hypothetical protein [Pseudomonas mosselii]